MKKILYFVLSCFISLITVSCEIDNYDGPNATITGNFLDSSTGEIVGTDITNGNSIGVYELGWDTEAKQTWFVDNSGAYTNNLVFAANYRLELTNCNFYPQIINDFVVNKGANTYDFNVTPYLRIINPVITFDATTNIVTATFSLESGGTNVNLNEIRLFAFSDKWVGNYVKFAITNSTCYMRAPGAISATVNPATQYVLTMDVAANPTLFKTTRDYFFRIGALATVPNVGTVRHNYSPLVTLNIAR
jgi:hypothetical protein